MKINKIKTSQLKAEINSENAVHVIDVRPDMAFQSGHIQNSINIPLENLKGEFEKLEKIKDQKIFVICQTNIRSGKGAKMLLKAGFENIVLVEDGIKGWSENGFSLS